jgi:hypothetical protein
VLLSSCYDYKPFIPEYTPLTVYQQLNTEQMTVDLSELSDFKDFPEKTYIVNSVDELPVDTHFKTDEILKANIDFTKFSLIISYQLILGDMVSYQYGWRYNNWSESYELNTTFVRVKGSEYVGGELSKCTYVRSAIIVKQVPSNSNYKVSTSISER